MDDEGYDPTPRWLVKERTLTAEIGTWRVAFAHAGTKLKTVGREASPARWDDLRPALENYTVTGVRLSGVVTQGTYGAVEVSDMKSRIDSFIAGADDSFHVPQINVMTGVGDDASSVAADFGEMMLQAQPGTTLATLTHVALDVLGYRYPTPEVDLDVLFGGEQAGEGAEDDAPVELRPDDS